MHKISSPRNSATTFTGPFSQIVPENFWNESTLLKGSYAPLRPYFARMNVDQLVLEFATPRAGHISGFDGKELGLGCVNPRTDFVETAEEIVARVRSASELVEPSKLFLNPDCGFGTFAARPMNEIPAIKAKLRAMVEAAEILRTSCADPS